MGVVAKNGRTSCDAGDLVRASRPPLTLQRPHKPPEQRCTLVGRQGNTSAHVAPTRDDQNTRQNVSAKSYLIIPSESIYHLDTCAQIRF